MKKLLISLFLITLVVSSVFADSKPKPKFKPYTYGSVEYDTLSWYTDGEHSVLHANLSAGIDISGKYLYLFVESEVHCDMNSLIVNDNLYFMPDHQGVTFRTGLWLGFLGIEYEHDSSYYMDSFTVTDRGFHDRVSLKFDSRRTR